jgi:4-carboxymuconolactone decarboxylase
LTRRVELKSVDGVEAFDRMNIEIERRQVAEEITSTRGGLGRPFKLLLESPELARRVAHTGQYLRFEGVLSARYRELAVLVVASQYQCSFEWQQHLPLAVEAGVSEAAIATVAKGEAIRDLPDIDRHESDLIEIGAHLALQHRVPSSLREDWESFFGARSFLELLATMGYYLSLAVVINGYE